MTSDIIIFRGIIGRLPPVDADRLERELARYILTREELDGLVNDPDLDLDTTRP